MSDPSASDDGRLLTTPEELSEAPVFLPTGNEWVSLPLVRPHDGALESINVLHMAAGGLVELCGRGAAGAGVPAAPPNANLPLLAPRIEVEGQTPGNRQWERLDHWLPRWQAEVGAVQVSGTVWAPPGHRGFVYLLTAANHGAAPVDLTLGLDGLWAQSRFTVYTARTLAGSRHVRRDRWSRGPVFELRFGLPVVAWAVAASAPDVDWQWRDDADGIAWQGVQHQTLAPGAEATLAFYVAVAREADGARTTAVDLMRRGWRRLLTEARAWLAARVRQAGDATLTGVLNLNMFFNYFYSQGYAIDSEDLALVTSRSPLYYVSAAFWARDALLWSLPAVILVEPAQARAMLQAAFTRYLRHAGVHSLYMDGTVLYPGFELDELAAYLVAVDRYVRDTGDAAVQDEPWLQQALPYLQELFRQHRHDRVALYDTFLYPSDDPATYPYLTYDNALSWRAFGVLADLYRRAGRAADAAAARAEAAAIRQAIYDHLVVPGPFGPMFAWSTDLQGAHKVYDEPPGTLQLLAYYGLCAADDPIYTATCRWIRSEHNPWFCSDGRFVEVGCPHSPHPFVMGIAASLLSGRAEAAHAILRAAPLDGGLACEAFDRQTGRVKTGAAFATCAGLLAWAMVQAGRANDP